MYADLLTKEMQIPQHLEDVFYKNYLKLPKTLINQVIAVGPEIRMHNIKNRRKLKETIQDES